MRCFWSLLLLILAQSVQGQQMAEEWNDEGIDYAIQGNYAEAVRCFDEAIRLDPDDASPWNNKGLAYDDQGNHAEAIRCYDEAMMLDPGLA